MKKSHTGILIFLIAVFTAGSFLYSQDVKSLKKLHWLKGKWSRVISGVEHFENWNITKEFTLEGEGFFLKSGNKKVTEKLGIKLLDNKLVYIADVPHNPNPVIFENVELNDTMAVFENKSHDYPNKITYIKLNKRSFRVILNNNAGTNSRVMTFTLVTRR